jgi:chromosome segregation ATPase
MAMKKGNITRRRIVETVLTVEKFQPIFEDIKELIQSTVKGAVTALREEFQKEIRGVKNEISGIKKDVNSFKGELHLTQAAVLENGRAIKKLEKRLEGGFTELRDEMHQMEGRLSEKIDGNAHRLNDHETRITNLENVH